jgi:hypothetical protein
MGHLKKAWVLLMIVLALSLKMGRPAYGQELPDDRREKNRSWDYKVNLRLYGADLALDYNGFSWLEGRDTKLWLSIGGGYEDLGFYRNSDGSVYDPPEHGDDLGVYRRSNLLGTVGLQQGIYEKGDSHLDWVAMFRISEEKYHPSKSPDGSLIFLSSLPDRKKVTEKSFLAGLIYRNVSKDVRHRTLKGFKAQATYEFVPDAWNDMADYHRFNLSLTGYVPIYTGDAVAMYMGDQLTYDRLDGDYIPITARTTFGGLSYFPGIRVSGLGGYMRGLPFGYRDGTVKIGNNFDFRINFSSLFGMEAVKPGIISFFDLGASDDQSHPEKLYKSMGLGLSFHFDWPMKNMDLIIYDAYAINDEQNRLLFGLGLPF